MLLYPVGVLLRHLRILLNPVCPSSKIANITQPYGCSSTFADVTRPSPCPSSRFAIVTRPCPRPSSKFANMAQSGPCPSWRFANIANMTQSSFLFANVTDGSSFAFSSACGLMSSPSTRQRWRVKLVSVPNSISSQDIVQVSFWWSRTFQPLTSSPVRRRNNQAYNTSASVPALDYVWDIHRAYYVTSHPLDFTRYTKARTSLSISLYYSTI